MPKEKNELKIENLEKKLEELEKKLEECENFKSQYLNGWQRAKADFLNYKKEEAERIEQFFKYNNEEFVLKILPILDNFEIAVHQKFFSKNINEEEKKEIEQTIQGFLQIKKQLEDFLKNQGVEEIKSQGEKFDPNLHEATEEVESSNNEQGIVIEEIQKGYKIQGRLLRPAKVRVAK